MKTVFKCLIATTILALSLVFGLSVYAEEQITNDSLWSYALNGENAVLTAYHGSATDVYVPSRVYIDSKEYFVTKLGDGAFKDNDVINSVTLGDSIKEIGAEAFYDCDGLVCILTTENVVSIGDKAFYGCDIFNSIILYDSINSIGSEAFSECPKLIVYCNTDSTGYSYAVENSIRYKILNSDAEPEIYTDSYGVEYYIYDLMGKAVVRSCSSEAQGEIYVSSAVPSKDGRMYAVTEVNDSAFATCTNITGVYLPDSITVIGARAFEACPVLSAVKLPEGISEIKDYTFCYSGITHLSVPANVKSIGAYAFHHSEALTGIELREGIEYIGANAFSYSGLKKIAFPKSTHTISNRAAYSCKSLSDISILNPEAHIADYAFAESGISHIRTPFGLKNLSRYAFYHNGDNVNIYIDNIDIWFENRFSVMHEVVSGYDYIAKYNLYVGGKLLKHLIVPSHIKTVPNEAFYNCKSVKKMTITDKLDNVGKNAFKFINLTEVEILSTTPGDIFPATVKTVRVDDLYGFIKNNPSTTLIARASSVYNNGVLTTEFVMPAEMTEVPLVFGISDSSYPNQWLKKFTVGDNVTEIPDYAFCNCTSLTDVIIPKSVAKIGKDAFKGCTSISNVYLEDMGSWNATELANVYSSPLYYAENLYINGVPKTELVIPETVTEITSGMAGNWVRKVTLHDKVTTIADNAFSGCSYITEITIPNGVTVIGSNAFSACSGLTEIVIPDSVLHMGANTFANCISLKSVTLSKNLESIGYSSFYNCTSLTSIDIPGTVKNIGNNTFYGCKNLKSVTIGYGVEALGNASYGQVFQGCTSLNEIILPNSVKLIGHSSFKNCTALESVVLSSGMTEIPQELFNNCTHLRNVVIPEGVTTIGSKVFYKCLSLSEIVIPKSVLSYEKNTWDLAYIGTFTVYENSFAHGNIPTGAANIKIVKTDLPVLTYSVVGGEASVTSCLTTFVGEIVIPDTYEGYPVTSISANAFKGCSDISSVVLPDTMTSIGNHAFYGCTSITKVTLSENLGRIGNYAFSGTRIKEICIPETVEYIGEGAFSNNALLKKVTGNVCASVIGAKAFEKCSSLSEITLCEGVESIDGDAFKDCRDLTTITIPQTVTNIGAWAFLNCRNLTEISIPNGVKTIGEGTFNSCKSLYKVTLPDSVTEILYGAFSGCSSLSDISFTDSVINIGKEAFSGCTSLKYALLPDATETIGDGAFYGCTSLEKAHIPNGITQIPANVFGGCTSLKTVDFNTGITIINEGAFAECTQLEDIIITPNITYVGKNAFRNCDKLTDIKISDSMKLQSGAFSYCDSIEALMIPSDINENIAADAFAHSKRLILLVFKDSPAHAFAKNNGYLYFIIRNTSNPEISYGTGIEGRVSYTDGSVASGVTVEILYDDGTVKESVKTDENGVYSFTYAEVGRYTVKATDAANLTASDTVSVKRMNVFDVFVTGETDLVLKNSWSVSGTVNTDEKANITLTDTDGKIIDKTESTDGTFTFENVSNGSYIIKVDTESASTTVEVTVFNGNVSDIVIDFPVDALYATVKGYVEIEDRELEHHRRSWVDVTIYDSEGIAVGSTKTDDDGAYCFKNLPADDYAIVAHTEENRPDKHKGHIRPHQLTGYSYVTVTEAVVYEVETIVLYEENEEKATLSGKVTANGEHQACEVILSDVFRHERARYETKKNGKYEFVNVNDGLYFVTAITESKGAGMTVVVVRYGRVYGDTDIRVYKHQHIHDRETKWHDDIPECHSREDAIRYRDRIAEEKRYFDGLPEKEKKQFSKEYRDTLNKYAEWIADYDFTCNDENVKVENGGMMVSGDELEAEEKIEIVLNIEKNEGHTIGDDGIKDKDDYLQQSIENSAGKHHIAEYYDITLLKKNGKKDQTITCISRDTDTTGKIRITMDIPEKYRGHKHYSFVHMHNGEAVTLTDLDNDPNTVTFEIDRFSTFTLIYTDEDLIAPSDADERLPFVGAQIRTEGTQALRFVYSITKELYDTLEKPDSTDDTSLGFGAVIMPKRYMNEGDILEKGYTNTVDGKQYSAKTVPAVKLFGEDDTSVSYTVALTGIKEENYTEEYVTVSYATYLDENGEEITVYGDTTQNVTVFLVAELAYADENTSDTVKQYIYDNILSVVDPVKYPKE